MTKIVKNVSDISSSHAVCIISSSSDIELLWVLKLDQNIAKKIRQEYKKKQDNCLYFFLGRKNFEGIYILITHKKDPKGFTEFLGKHFSKLPKNYTLFCLNSDIASTTLETCLLSRYSFQRFKSERDLDSVYVYAGKDIDKKIIQQSLEKVENISLARDLWETPSNELTPEAFAKLVKKTKFKNTKVRILSPKDIEKKWLGLIHAVGKGSENKPYMVILEKIQDKKLPSYGIVGKGITFDTGGIQVKPENFMYEMKGDMWGAAVTFALMKQLDSVDLGVNVVACLCLAENAISSTSYKPSDICTGYTGKTVEIIHTDAEGRLVLADGVSYISKNYTPKHMITIATLTWAVMVALGYRYAGVMGTDKNFIQKLLKYSKDHTEQYVELPFDDNFLEKTQSKIADFKNLDRTVHAGSSMWGAFLYNFLENKEEYTHIDIAGTYLNGGDPYGKMPSGATWFGVESLSDIFQSL